MMRSQSVAALISSVIVILAAGFPLTFSLYATSFQTVLKFSQTQVNAVNVSNIVGQFLAYPLIGYCSDRFGPHVVAACGAFFTVPALFGAAAAYEKRASYVILSIMFFWIGIGSNCGYITSVSTCARTFRQGKGLAMSIPICAYGLATLLFSLVYEACFSTPSGYDIPGFWRTISVFVIMASIVAFFGMTTVQGNVNEEVVSEPSEEDVLLRTSTNTETPIKIPFFRDVTVLLYATGYVLISGSTETLVGNMGSILESITAIDPLTDSSVLKSTGSQASTVVSVFAVFSTVSRLFTGWALDGLVSSGYSRFHLPIFLVGLPMCLNFLVLSLVSMNPSRFMFVVAVNGFTYGSMYASGPNIAATVWGLQDFGRNWGVIAYAPLFGSVLASLMYAQIYDSGAEDNDGRTICRGQSCFSTSFLVLAFAILLGVILWTRAWVVWRRRLIKV